MPQPRLSEPRREGAYSVGDWVWVSFADGTRRAGEILHIERHNTHCPPYRVSDDRLINHATWNAWVDAKDLEPRD